MAFDREHLKTVLAMKASKSKILMFGDQERRRGGGTLQRRIK